MIDLQLASEVELVAYRGVRYYEEFTVRENLGTAVQPIAGDPVDLTLWSRVASSCDVSGANPREAVPSAAAVVSLLDGRFSLQIEAADTQRAFDGEASRPLRVTVVAFNAALQWRVLLNGTIRVEETGF